jgi:hypothetical protein
MIFWPVLASAESDMQSAGNEVSNPNDREVSRVQPGEFTQLNRRPPIVREFLYSLLRSAVGFWDRINCNGFEMLFKIAMQNVALERHRQLTQQCQSESLVMGNTALIQCLRECTTVRFQSSLERSVPSFSGSVSVYHLQWTLP